MKNIKRIKYYEKIFNQVNILKFDYKNNKALIDKKINALNKYYGSKDWFSDREDYDNNKIPKVKAGVLSEDAIWNMNEEINYLIDEMKAIIKYFDKEK